MRSKIYVMQYANRIFHSSKIAARDLKIRSSVNLPRHAPTVDVFFVSKQGHNFVAWISDGVYSYYTLAVASFSIQDIKGCSDKCTSFMPLEASPNLIMSPYVPIGVTRSYDGLNIVHRYVCLDGRPVQVAEPLKGQGSAALRDQNWQQLKETFWKYSRMLHSRSQHFAIVQSYSSDVACGKNELGFGNFLTLRTVPLQLASRCLSQGLFIIVSILFYWMDAKIRQESFQRSSSPSVLVQFHNKIVENACVLPQEWALHFRRNISKCVFS
jgi:hypothetical protein